MTDRKTKWKEEAWEALLVQKWDTRGAACSVEYSVEDLNSILSKYTKSGQGEIRIFHSGSTKVFALKKRGVVKIPISRTQWKLVQAPKPLEFKEPQEGGIFSPQNELTEGMVAGIVDTLETKSNPGETTLLAIAKHTGLIRDFYTLTENGVLFTGGRQKAKVTVHVNGDMMDMSKAQIEIDGGFEWPMDVVIAEMKSSFKQTDFDTNQALLPMLKWKKLLPQKTVHSLVLLAETHQNNIEYWAYDIGESGAGLGAEILKSKKYIIELNHAH
ncbi:MAG: hypothetical protein RLZZ342_33 [Candidatus Parcubacteria bacterium]|jgi:hypothetical protein